jgi:hypothetical protein
VSGRSVEHLGSLGDPYRAAHNAQSPERQHRLRGKALATRKVNGKVLDQWQYEVTSGGRIWYCPDPDERVVWLTDAGPGHPKATE